MKTPALWLVTSLYAWQAIECLLRSQFGASLILGGYVVANIGLIIMVGK